MADTNKGAALLLNDAGNIDRARTTDGSIFRIESTLSMEAAEEAKTAAANCNTATESAEAAEKTRVSNENARKTAEIERKNNETERKSNEISRQNNETERKNNEIERKKAEDQRHSEHIADQQALTNAVAAANGAASRADVAANQALQIANSVAQGSAGSSDIADLRAQNAKLATLLANSTGQFIYMGGTVYCPASKASASGVTVTFGSTCSASGNTITLI